MSIKQADPDYRPKSAAEVRRAKIDFEDRLSRFLKESDERLADLKKTLIPSGVGPAVNRKE